MEVKELKTNERNLFDYIKYFDGLENTNTYFNEFCLNYGKRKLLECIEELFKVDNLSSIGLLFDLKSQDWKDTEKLNKEMFNLVNSDKQIISKNNESGTVKRERNNKENTENIETVAPYDEEEYSNREKNNKDNTITDNENTEDSRAGTKETVYKGFNFNQVNYLKYFVDNPNYRYTIYEDIINMIALQIY